MPPARLVLSLFALLAASAAASGLEDYTVPGVETGAVLMSVHVWGEVRTPGTVAIPVGSDLVVALSAAGGPTGNADLGKIRIVSDQESEIEYDMDDFLDGHGGDVPVLIPGATVFVPLSRTEWWKETIDFAYKIIIAVNLVWIMTER